MRFLLALLILANSFTGVASANGMPIYEMNPAVPLVPDRNTPFSLLSEELAFSFPGNEYPWVTARYLLKNTGREAARTGVAFLYAGTVPDVQARWRGEPLEVERLESLPPEGLLPDGHIWRTSHWLEPKTGRVYAVKEPPARNLAGFRFAIDLPAGAEGELLVTFRQGMTGCDRCTSRNRIRHYTYLLSPARNWASVGPVSIRIEVPPGLMVATDPPLRSTSGTAGARLLAFQFPTLPDGELHISTQRAPTWLDRLGTWGVAALAVIAVGALYLRLWVRR